MQKEEIVRILKSKKEYFIKKYGIEIIGIFGSYARGEARNNSDIDILYRYSSTKNIGLFGLLKMIGELENIFHKKIDLIPFEKLKPFVEESAKKDMIRV